MLTAGPSCSSSPQAPILILPKGFLLLPIIRSTHTGSLLPLMGDLLGHTMHGHPGGAGRWVSQWGKWCLETPEQDWSPTSTILCSVAPEVVGRQRYGRPVDCWAIGVIMYIL